VSECSYIRIASSNNIYHHSIAFGVVLIIYGHEPPQLVVNDALASKAQTVFYSFIPCSTIVSNPLIAGRILYLGGKPGLSKYRHVVEIVVESAALYMIIIMIYIPLAMITDPVASLPVYIIQALFIPITVSMSL
jgi:hypothetical protein